MLLRMSARSAACALVALLLGALLGGPSTAAAAPAKQTVKKSVWGPITIDGVPQFPIYKDLGVGIYQYPVEWRQYAPTEPANPRDPDDPAYLWTQELDDAVREAGKNGIQVALRVSRSPGWANKGRDFRFLPTDLSDYADFLEALAKRYPSVRLWQIWEEPNRATQLDLDSTRPPITGFEDPPPDPLTARQRVQVRRYAELVDLSYGRLKKLAKRNEVIAGTFTSCGSVAPQRFIQGMRLKNGKPPRMDQFGVNPYSPRAPDLKLGRFGKGCADFGDLDVVTTWVDKYLHRSGRNSKLPIFISEYSQPTDVENYLFPWHLTPAAQARFVAQALRAVRRNPRLRTFGWYAYQDLPVFNGRECRVGLVDIDGKKKPAWYAFKRG